MRHLPMLRWTVGIVAAFACCIVALGHGIVPLGVPMLVGITAWPWFSIVSWAPLVMLLVARRLMSEPVYRRDRGREEHEVLRAGALRAMPSG